MKKMILSSLTLFSISAWSASGTSMPNYYMYTPKSGGSEFLAGLTMYSSEIAATNSTNPTKGSGLGVNLSYAYGFSNMAAFTFDQKIHSFEVKDNTTKTEYKTLSPTVIGLKGFIVDKGPQFFYNLNYSMAVLEKRDSDDGDNTFYPDESRDYLKAGLGFAMPVGSMFSFGLKADYYMFQDTDNTSSNITTKYKSGSGTEWKGFAQFDMGAKLGLSYGELTIDSFDTVTNGVTSVNSNKLELKKMALYTIIGFGNTDLLIDVQKWDLKDKTGLDKYDVMFASVGARMNF